MLHQVIAKGASVYELCPMENMGVCRGASSPVPFVDRNACWCLIRFGCRPPVLILQVELGVDVLHVFPMSVAEAFAAGGAEVIDAASPVL